MLGRRRRRRPNIEPTLGQRIVFAGVPHQTSNKYYVNVAMGQRRCERWANIKTTLDHCLISAGMSTTLS